MVTLYSTVTVALSESYGDNTNATVSVNGDVVVGPGVGSNTACVDLDGCVSFVYDGNGEYFTNEDSWTVTVDSVVVIDAGGYSTSWVLTQCNMVHLALSLVVLMN